MDREHSEGQMIKYPNTANLLIDSGDKISGNVGNFLISKTNEALMNGFFNSISVSEVVMEWFEPNWTGGTVNYAITANGGYTQSGNFQIASGAYFLNCSQFIQLFVNAMNAITATTGLAFANPSLSNTVIPGASSVITLSGPLAGKTTVNLLLSNGSTAGTSQNQSVSRLLTQLLYLYTQPYLNTGATARNLVADTAVIFMPNADMRVYPYLDIVSNDLTYNQKVKDGSTATNNRTVICRWYFAFDNPPFFDELNYPILMGYTPFVLRRLFNNPKQIRWNKEQQVGQLSFQLYDNTGTLFVPNTSNVLSALSTNYLITLQVSES
jgi:hypothetical protein